VTLRWKQQERPTGLAAVGARHPGHRLHDGTLTYAIAYPARRGFNPSWYWVAGWDSSVPHKNTCDEPVADAATAKAEALAYVKQHLKTQQPT
jgi:hypothetical protein